MIPVRKVRELSLDSHRSEGPPHVSAASSLEQLNDTLYVIADDELRLAVFPRLGAEDGYAVPVLDGGRSPDDPAARKEGKADLESLTLLPPFDSARDGALLALGSGSGPKRNNAVVVPLGADGAPTAAHRIDLGPLYDELRERVEQLNIEGAAVIGDVLRLLQRGNNGTGSNVIIDLSLEEVLGSLRQGAPLTAAALGSLEERDLGRLHGVDLAFSDASPLPDGRVVFAASAEDTTDSYEDGPVLGSAVGIMNAGGDIEMVEPIDVEVKLEGLTARPDGDGIHVFLVTDADDPGTPSPLLEARF